MAPLTRSGSSAIREPLESTRERKPRVKKAVLPMAPPTGSRSSAVRKPSKSTRERNPRERKGVLPKKFRTPMLRQGFASLADMRKLCDRSFPGRLGPNGDVRAGASVTITNPVSLGYCRDKAMLALEFFKKEARVKECLELVKISKVNLTGGGTHGLTFTAAEPGSSKGFVFQGVVRSDEARFCEVKEEIKLAPSYVGGS